MKKFIPLVLVAVLTAWTYPATAAEKSDGGHGSHKAAATEAPGTFRHEAVSDGVAARFEVMSLAAMKIKDPGGATHHIMVKLFREGSEEPIRNAVGKVKFIDPENREAIADLQDAGDILAANFTAGKAGKYGIICLIRVDDRKLVYKFWYHHM